MNEKARRIIRNDRPTSNLQVGDRVFVPNAGLIGRHKWADRWRSEEYVIVRHREQTIPVHEVRPVPRVEAK